MIVDCHMHLGDILHDKGESIISQSIKMPKRVNIQWFEESILGFRNNTITQKLFALLDDKYTKSVQDRIKSGTYENFLTYKQFLQQKSRDYFTDGNVYFACMPISPYVTFDNLIKYSDNDPSLLPFTSIDPSSSICDACNTVSSQMQRAYGLKLHPIIQGITFDSKKSFEVLDSIKQFNKPVLLHSRSSRYYLGEERKLHHLEYDDIKAAKKMVESFPDLVFILGHAGCSEMVEWADEFSALENVFVDITVQSEKSIRYLLNQYGEDRILFASDWPCINLHVTFKIAIKSLTIRQKEKGFFENASTLFGLK